MPPEPTAPSSPQTMQILDLRGEVCPFTFVRTKLALEGLPAGARLCVLVDHEPATRNVPRSLLEWGQKVLLQQPAPDLPGVWEIHIEKQPPKPTGSDRRVADREPIHAEVQLLGDTIHILRAKNLSVSGVFVELDPAGGPAADAAARLTSGASVELVVTHHGGAVRSLARVIRHAAGGVGLVFDGLDDDSRSLLRTMIVRASRARAMLGKDEA